MPVYGNIRASSAVIIPEVCIKVPAENILIGKDKRCSNYVTEIEEFSANILTL